MTAMGWIIGILVVVVAAAAGVWRIGAMSQRPRLRPNTEPPGGDVHCEAITYSNSGSSIAGWLLRREQDRNAGPLPTIVVAHGWSSNRSRVLRYVQPLYEAGYAVFMYDARSHGDSDCIKAPSGLMFRDDVLAAVKQASQMPQVDANRIAVLGHSMGGFGAVLALAKGLRVKAIITDSTPVRFETMMKSELKRKKVPFFPLGYFIPGIWLIRSGISRSEFREASIPDVLKAYAGEGQAGRTPVLMIHSNGDDFIPVEDLRELEQGLPRQIMDTLYVDTAGHSASEQAEPFWQRVLPFLHKHV